MHVNHESLAIFHPGRYLPRAESAPCSEQLSEKQLGATPPTQMVHHTPVDECHTDSFAALKSITCLSFC